MCGPILTGGNEEYSLPRAKNTISSSLDYTVLYTTVPSNMIKEADYFDLRPSPSTNTPKKLLRKQVCWFVAPFSHPLRRPKMSRSVDDISSLYSFSSTASHYGPDHGLRNSFNEWMLLDRRTGEDGSSTPPEERGVPSAPTPLSLEEKCRGLLDEKYDERKPCKKTMRPQRRAVYGDLDSSSEFFDIAREACADYSLCSISEEEFTINNIRKVEWEAEKTRGIHFPSVLKVRRIELAALRENPQETHKRINLRPRRPGRAVAINVVQGKCKRCAEFTTDIPPGLKPSDWLPLVYLRRAQRCELQRPNPQQAREARTIFLNRMMKKSEPNFAVWTCKRARNSCQKPSLLSNGQRRAASIEQLFILSASCRREEEASEVDTVVEHCDDEAIKGGAAREELEMNSDSSSEYSQETIVTSEDTVSSPGVYRALEVPELQWTKRYRIPKFFATGRHDHDFGKSYLDRVIEEEEEIPVLGYDLNKPLPPLPSPSPPPQVKTLRDGSYSKSLRRSRSATSAHLTLDDPVRRSMIPRQGDEHLRRA
ncbi:hypothetical protein ACEPAI_6663 [Sanghuangporus weigelae]